MGLPSGDERKLELHEGPRRENPCFPSIVSCFVLVVSPLSNPKKKGPILVFTRAEQMGFLLCSLRFAVLKAQEEQKDRYKALSAFRAWPQIEVSSADLVFIPRAK